MQKILRRTALAKDQAKRRTIKLQKVKERREQNDGRKERQAAGRLISRYVREERKNRRDDWLRGPLAARRDVGEVAKHYGAVPSNLIRPGRVREPREFGIFQGDRVAVSLPGHKDKGKIGVVTNVNKDSETCEVKDMNMVDVQVPEHMLQNQTDKSLYRPFSLPLPLSGVKLVARLPNRETGEDRDVVINQLVVTKNRSGRPRREVIRRYIQGVMPRIWIPLPEEKEVEHPNHEDDTLRIDVEEKTLIHSMMQPMPSSVIDELRNKYSVFRTRHDPEYIARKVNEHREQRESKSLLDIKMMTPMAEFRLKQQAERRARGDPELSDAMLAKIGEVMERNLQLSEARRPESTIASGSA